MSTVSFPKSSKGLGAFATHGMGAFATHGMGAFATHGLGAFATHGLGVFVTHGMHTWDEFLGSTMLGTVSTNGSSRAKLSAFSAS